MEKEARKKAIQVVYAPVSTLPDVDKQKVANQQKAVELLMSSKKGYSLAALDRMEFSHLLDGNIIIRVVCKNAASFTFTWIHPRNRTTDDKIDAWHNGDGGNKALHEYLGWTEKEYAHWVETSEEPQR